MPDPYIISIPYGTHRAHSPICDLLNFYAVTIAAIRARPEYAQIGTKMRFTCASADTDLVYDFKDMIDHIVDGDRPNFVYFEAYSPIAPDLNGGTIEAVRAPAEHLAAAVFSFFVEPAVDWIKRHVTSDYHRFPPIANFARVVRNALVHGGTVNINNPNSATVSWRGRTYGHAQHGQKILNTGTGLSTGHLIFLMLELSDELDALGAPLNLF